MPARLSVPLALVGAVLLLVLSGSASGHVIPQVHSITLTPGTSSSVRQTTFTSHSGFKLRETAYFGTVNRTCAFLRYINFYIYDIQPGGMGGGRAHVWNSNTQLTYGADAGRIYYSPATYRLGVSRWFCGGQSNGNASVAVEKDNIASCWDDCAWHRSSAIYRVP
jgi:hypothetical protein